MNSKTTAERSCQNFKSETSQGLSTTPVAQVSKKCLGRELTVDISVVVCLEHIPQLDDILVVVEFLQKHDFSVREDRPDSASERGIIFGNAMRGFQTGSEDIT
jgi:hypothetical protein